MAKKAASKRGKKALKVQDLSPRNKSEKVRGGAVGPCFGKGKKAGN